MTCAGIRLCGLKTTNQNDGELIKETFYLKGDMRTETRQAIFDYFDIHHDVRLLEGDLDELQNIISKHESDLIEKAFLAGRSKTSWEQFKIDNSLQPLPK